MIDRANEMKLCFKKIQDPHSKRKAPAFSVGAFRLEKNKYNQIYNQIIQKIQKTK